MTDAMKAPVIIAEAGVNHNGDLKQAIALVRAAKHAGADVVKFQYFTADSIVVAGTEAVAYQKANSGQQNQAELLRALELDLNNFAKLAGICREEGIAFLCTSFKIDAIDALVALGMPYVKIPSGELTNIPLLDRYARCGLPVLLSTGMGTMDEVAAAVAALEKAGAREITLLQCTSLYPAAPDTLNLRAMTAMAKKFEKPVGFSDHSLDDYAAIAAVALGASVIEKHFTLDRNAPGPDHRASLEPDDFTCMVQRLRATAQALGDGVKRPAPGEAETARLGRRSWHAAHDLAAGIVIQKTDVVLKRPASGLPPAIDPSGRRILSAVAADSPITADMLES